jgi:N,N'-diacetyllegionaminate synthase
VNPVNVGTFSIGPGKPCFVIAEAGVNHNGDIAIALRLVDAAVRAGVDAVKFQTFKADRIVSQAASKAEYQLRTTSADESQLHMLRRLELSIDAHRELVCYCEDRGMLFLSTPFDEDSADELERLGVAAFKIPSGEITNLDLVRHVAHKGKPVILSTGMAYLGEVETALRTIRDTGNSEVILLHCVSNYPADACDANLRAMGVMRDAFQVPVGYSDHTLGTEVALAAVALGACVVEKHFTLDRTMSGPDHTASLDPDDLASLVKGIRRVEQALGHGRKEPAASEMATAAVARKSLVAEQDIPAGTVLTRSMIAVKRPGTGISPSLAAIAVGRSARRDIQRGTVLAWEMFV